MRKLLLIISVLLSFNVLNAQQQKDTLNYFSISKEQRVEWNKIEDKWRLDYFNSFLKKHKLKTSCAHCYSINFEASFTISENGNTKIELVSNQVCGKKFNKKQEAELIQLLQKIIFPKEFYDGIFIFKIGKTLKC